VLIEIEEQALDEAISVADGLGTDPHLDASSRASIRSTNGCTIRACSAGSSSFQTVAK
jgi:hypothetical protein